MNVDAFAGKYAGREIRDAVLDENSRAQGPHGDHFPVAQDAAGSGCAGDFPDQFAGLPVHAVGVTVV